MLTVLPLALGLASWVCSICSLILRNFKLLTAGWLLCAWALLFPLVQTDLWVAEGDVPAILDVTGGFLFGGAILLSVNTLLTAVSLFRVNT